MTKTFYSACLIVSFFTLISCHFKQDPTSTQEKIDRLISDYQSKGRFNGTLLVAKDDQVIISKGYGYADMEWDIKITPETKFQIGSVTKVFTATVIAKLIDEGKLNLQTRLSAVLPWYRKDIGDKVTIDQLLNHTSGIPNYFGRQNKSMDEIMADFGFGDINKLEFAKRFCSYDLEFEPGTKWKYSNSGYFLLGLIIEHITGKPYSRVVQEMIFDPLGMESSGDIQPDPEAIVKNIATGYVKNFGGYSRASYWNLSTTYAAGSLYSTPADLMKFNRALYTDTFVSARSKQAMFTPGLNGYGCGWELREIPIGADSAKKKIQTHEGYLRAWHSRIYRIPEDGYFIVILSNAGEAPLEFMFDGITDILYGRNPKAQKRILSDVLYAEFRKNGMQSAVATAKSMAEKDSVDKNENDLNSLGYYLLFNGQIDEAQQVFQLNTEFFPASWNVWDSYGESLAKTDRTSEAIVAYEKSVQLNPSNASGKEALERLKKGL